MALKELYRALTGQDSDFIDKVSGAVFIAARDIQAEDPGTANHAARAEWAILAVDNPKRIAHGMLADVLQNATIAADVAGATDSDIQYVVNSVISETVI